MILYKITAKYRILSDLGYERRGTRTYFILGSSCIDLPITSSHLRLRAQRDSTVLPANVVFCRCNHSLCKMADVKCFLSEADDLCVEEFLFFCLRRKYLGNFASIRPKED
jgi:hypothetical protein